MSKTIIDDRTSDRVNTPGMYRVVYLNDDYTPIDFVIHSLQKVFHRAFDDAFNISMKIHESGSAVVGIYPMDIAETKADTVMTLAMTQQHPLMVIVEKE